jgi:ubiquinone/menaquinone biosynthesis C-methylase UbiE
VIKQLTWEEAVESLRRDASQTELVRACYYDDPLLDAARRFRQSEEWLAIRSLLGPGRGQKVLDLGAGRGIASYAFAMDGWKVTALEPDPSPIVGADAIRSLAADTPGGIEVVETFGEELPFADGTFDVVYGRAVLHHARDLDQLLKECGRVLAPRGKLLMTREHVISRQDDKEAFLNTHPLHHLYGGENAFTMDEYRWAIAKAGLTMMHALGPRSTPINHFPVTSNAMAGELVKRLRRRVGKAVAKMLVSIPAVRKELLKRWDDKDQGAGRLYSFLAAKV